MKLTKLAGESEAEYRTRLALALEQINKELRRRLDDIKSEGKKYKDWETFKKTPTFAKAWATYNEQTALGDKIMTLLGYPNPAAAPKSAPKTSSPKPKKESAMPKKSSKKATKTTRRISKTDGRTDYKRKRKAKPLKYKGRIRKNLYKYGR